jgi:hypothetical protein
MSCFDEHCGLQSDQINDLSDPISPCNAGQTDLHFTPTPQAECDKSGLRLVGRGRIMDFRPEQFMPGRLPACALLWVACVLAGRPPPVLRIAWLFGAERSAVLVVGV